MTSLREWLGRNHGTVTLTKVYRRAEVSWQTACRAAKGEKLGLAAALHLAEATNWEVALLSLTHDADAEVLERYVVHRLDAQAKAKRLQALANRATKRRKAA